MNEITAEVVITSDRRLILDVALPSDCPIGPATVTLNLSPKTIAQTAQKPASNKMAALRAKYRGQICMSDDFDAPLEDFAEYM